MIFRSDNPENDASDHLRWLDSLPDEPVRTEMCDCCLTQQEDFRLSPDEGGFTCVECIGRTFENSQAVKKFRDCTNHTEQELKDWFTKLKFK